MQVLPFIWEEDKIPLRLAFSLYNRYPIEIEPFKLTANNKRAASWTDGYNQIIGIRGSYIGGQYANLDERDDLALSATAHCDLTIIPFADKLIDPTKKQIFAGHSLGGSAALCLTSKYPQSRGNATAPNAAQIYINTNRLRPR